MKKIITFTIVAVLSATLFLGSALAFGDKTGLEATFDELAAVKNEDSQGSFFDKFKQKMFIRQILNRVADRLKLADEQKAQIRLIIKNEVPVVKPILINGVLVHKQLAALGRDGVYNEQEVNRLSTLQAKNARLLIVEKEKVKAQIFAVLTPEQRTEAEKIRDEFQAQIQKRIEEAMSR
jgi:Spy/CpxP family protein refolding chaperone